ncbi:MAG: inorganic diphosphatase [Bacteroidetes bacterium]|nr:inorganic diphosphatase [Bacteroidota bacterium]
MITVKHPWHGVNPGYETPEKVYAVVEIPQGSRSKYEIDKDSGLLKLDRVIYSSFIYPVNYGFIPQTLGDDGDPLDVLVICSQSIEPLCLVEATVIGNMQMIDQGKKDDKIIAVATHDPTVNFIKDIQELPAHFFDELKQFFSQYKVLENKTVEIDAFQHKKEALPVISAALTLYKEKFRQ